LLCDSSGVIHIKIGKLDMDDEKLAELYNSAVHAIEEVLGKPYNQVIKRLHIAPTMVLALR
jgi:ribosomal protein L1